jgi:meso-butanediol dehydrogenase / (S,S)-butanediol dehydrogenase / diacetyl reductase
VLYDNASMPRFATFAQQSDEDYRFTIDNELHLVWIASQIAWPHLAASRGAIVNVGSGAGLAGVSKPAAGSSRRGKGAVMALTRQLAAEGIAVGIRVNSVSPGVMGTPPILAMYESLGTNAPVASIVERTIM